MVAYSSFEDENLSADDADSVVTCVALVGHVVPLWWSPSMSKPRRGPHRCRCRRRRRRPYGVMSMGFMRPIIRFLWITTRLSRPAVVRIVIGPGGSRSPRPICRRCRCCSCWEWRWWLLWWQWSTWYIAPQFAFRSTWNIILLVHFVSVLFRSFNL